MGALYHLKQRLVDFCNVAFTNQNSDATVPSSKVVYDGLNQLNDNIEKLEYYGTTDILSYVRAVYTAIPESGSRIVWGGCGRVRYISFQFKPSAAITSGSVTLPESFKGARSQTNAALSSVSGNGGFVQIGGRVITIRCQADTQNFLCGQLIFFVE